MGDIGIVVVVVMVLGLRLGLKVSVIDKIVLSKHRVVRVMKVHVLSLQILVILVGMGSSWLLVLGQKRIEINEIVFGRMVFSSTARLCKVCEVVIVMLHLNWSLLNHRNRLGLGNFEIEFKQTDLNFRFYNGRSCVFGDFDRLRLLWFGLADLGCLLFWNFQGSIFIWCQWINSRGIDYVFLIDIFFLDESRYFIESSAYFRFPEWMELLPHGDRRMTFPIFIDLFITDEHVVDPLFLPDVEVGWSDSCDGRPKGSVSAWTIWA